MKLWPTLLCVLLLGCSTALESETNIPVNGYGTSTMNDALPSDAESASADADPDALDDAPEGAALGEEVGPSERARPEEVDEAPDEEVAPREDSAQPAPEPEEERAPDATEESVDDVAPEPEEPAGPVEVVYEPCAPEFLETDTDGDGLSDCDELSDLSESTDPTRYNGLTATVGVPPEGFLSSAQCGLFFGTDYGELDQHFTPSNQSMSILSGWEYSAGTTANYGDESNFDFTPNWEHSDNVGVWDSFQLLYTGWLYIAENDTYCFSIDTGAGGFGPGDIAGRRNNCGLLYTNPEPASAPLVQTGYGSNESPHQACDAYEAGWHRLAIAARHYETYFYAPKLAVRWCQGEGCAPETPLARELMHSDAEEVPLPETVWVEPEVPQEPTGGADASEEPQEDGGQVEEPGPEPTEGACTNASDSEVIDALGEGGLTQGITDCGMPCFFDGDKEGCIAECIEGNLGLSAECALCYAAPAACAMANCVSECLDGGNDCDLCRTDNGCQDDFTACSGLAN